MALTATEFSRFSSRKKAMNDAMHGPELRVELADSNSSSPCGPLAVSNSKPSEALTCVWRNQAMSETPQPHLAASDLRNSSVICRSSPAGNARLPLGKGVQAGEA